MDNLKTRLFAKYTVYTIVFFREKNGRLAYGNGTVNNTVRATLVAMQKPFRNHRNGFFYLPVREILEILSIGIPMERKQPNDNRQK